MKREGMNIRVGDRVRYSRGARASVFGKLGIVLRVYTSHGATMLDVDFETEVYPCWIENVDPEDTFDDIEVTTII